VDIDISMDIHRKFVDMDMDMDGKFHIHGKPQACRRMTCISGYKLFARAFMDGDGSGKSTHLSLYFVVARGNFDALLRWPFNQRVTMTLIDQVS